MPWAAAAAVVAAGIGAASSNKASKEQAKGVEKGLSQSAELAAQARKDVDALFQRSAANSGIGSKAALDYYRTAAPKRYTPYLQGNQQAQTVIGQGAQQANNAILGLPVDMSFTQQPQIVPGNDHLIGAEIPQFQQGIIAQDPQVVGPAQSGGGGSSTSAKDILTGNFSLGGNSSTKKKLDSLSPSKRLIKKIF